MIGDELRCNRCKKIFFSIYPEFQDNVKQECPWCHTIGYYKNLSLFLRQKLYRRLVRDNDLFGVYPVGIVWCVDDWVNVFLPRWIG